MSIDAINPFYNYSNVNQRVNGGSFSPQPGAVEYPQVQQQQKQSEESLFLQEASKLPLAEKIALIKENEEYLNALSGVYDIDSAQQAKNENPFAFNLASARKMSPEYSPSIVDADFRTDSDFSERFPEGLCC